MSSKWSQGSIREGESAWLILGWSSSENQLPHYQLTILGIILLIILKQEVSQSECYAYKHIYSDDNENADGLMAGYADDDDDDDDSDDDDDDDGDHDGDHGNMMTMMTTMSLTRA